MKLKFNNDKFLNEKKQKEYILINEKNNKKKIIELKEKLDEYKEIYKNKSNEIENLKQIGKEKIKILMFSIKLIFYYLFHFLEEYEKMYNIFLNCFF